MRAGDGVLEVLSGPLWNDPASTFLTFIDPYGSTIFNHLQAGPFCEELLHHAEKLTRRSDKESVDRIADLATQCADGHHDYLAFYGD